MSGSKESFAMGDEENFKSPFSPLSFPDHSEFAERIRKTLYYGTFPTDERPSLPMTGLAVDFLRDAAPKELGKIDMYWAADVGRKAYISPCSLMLGMIYIERLKHKNPDYLNQVSSSDLFLISMMVASKYLYDEGIDEEVYNDEWAESADMEVQDINLLEREFLKAIDWSLFTKPEDFERLLQSMEESIALTQGVDRGWYWTYSDLTVLLSNLQLQGTLKLIIEELCKVVVVCSIAYTAGSCTLLGTRSVFSIVHTRVLPVHQPMTTLAAHFSAIFGDSKTDQELLISISMDNEDQSEEIGNLTDKKPDLPHDHHYSRGVQLPLSDVGKDHMDQSEQTAEMTIETPMDQGKIGLSFPGFLTLALIKDTVTQFLSNGSTRRKDCGSCCCVDEETPEYQKNSINDCSGICSCSGCPSKMLSRRKKLLRQRDFVTRKVSKINCLMISPYGLWSSLKNAKRCMNRTSILGNCQGICNSAAPLSNLEDSTGVSFINDYPKDKVMENLGQSFSRCKVWNDNLIKESEKCLVKNPIKSNFGQIPCRVESKFIDLTARFQTSAQVAIAG